MGPTHNGNTVGQCVCELRYQKGWTQEELATKIQLMGCHMTRDVVANIETRRSTVTDTQILFLAEVLGVKAGDLFANVSRSAKAQRGKQIYDQ